MSSKPIIAMEGYRDAVERMDEMGLEGEMQTMLRRWDLDDDATRERYEASPVDALKRIYANFEIGGESIDAVSYIRRHVARASTIYHAMFTRGMFDATPAYKISMQNLLRVLLYAQNTVINLAWCRAAMKPHADDSHVDDHIIARFSPIDTEDNTPFQNLLLYLLNQAYAKNFRKHLGFCYEAIHRNGYNTHAWKNVSTIQEFVYDVTNKEMHFDQWKNLTHGRDNARAASEYLSKCKDGQFPDLVMDRHVFAFRNGVYHCAHREFDGAPATDVFYAFESGKRPVPPHLTACNFFDRDFDNFDGVDDWQDIPTPHLHSILSYQKFSKEVCRWMYVFLGRLLFDVGELDGWQVVPFLKGLAGSGKCFSKGTPVLMYDGTVRPIETIGIGDRVMGDDSAPRTVRTLARGDDEMFRIVPTKGDPYVVTREHVLCLKYSSHGVVRKQRDGFVVSIFDFEKKRTMTKIFSDLETAQKFASAIDSDKTFEMTVDEFVNLPKSIRGRLMGYRVSSEFPAVLEPPLFDPWLIGYWLGDGDSAGTGITTADEDIVQKIREILPSSLRFNAVGTAKYKYRITTGERQGVGGTNEFINMLKSYDLVNNKHIPHVLKTGSRDTRLKVLAGLLDSDGYLEVGDTCYEITQKSETLARDIEFVARSLGFGCYVTECQKSCTVRGEKKTGTYYRMHISGAGLEDLPMVLERKKAKNRIRNKDVLRYGISSIEPAGVQAYYGFECDGNHRFLLGDFSVTHNSTVVLKVAREFYDANDVGILSNNIEKKFGLSAFHDKFLFCAPEVKSDLHIEQAEFQSMVSGESLQINEKFKTAKSIEWKVPGILAGNEVPTWCDNAGSIARRIVLFDFERKVTHGDMELGKKLESEMPAILKKCASAYLEAARKCGNQNVWNYLPAYFKNLQSEMAAATNSLENFLQSEKIVMGEDLYCDWQSFIRAAQAHAKEYNFNLKTVSKDFYSGPFDKYKITLDKTKKKALKYPRNASGETRRCFWVFGCDLTANVEGDDVVGDL